MADVLRVDHRGRVGAYADEEHVGQRAQALHVGRHDEDDAAVPEGRRELGDPRVVDVGAHVNLEDGRNRLFDAGDPVSRVGAQNHCENLVEQVLGIKLFAPDLRRVALEEGIEGAFKVAVARVNPLDAKIALIVLGARV